MIISLNKFLQRVDKIIEDCQEWKGILLNMDKLAKTSERITGKSFN